MGKVFSSEYEDSPSAYIEYQNQLKKEQETRESGNIDIGKEAFNMFCNDIGKVLFTVEEEEEELKVDDMDAEQLRQYYHE